MDSDFLTLFFVRLLTNWITCRWLMIKKTVRTMWEMSH